MGTSEMMRRCLWRRAVEFMVVMVLLVGSGLSQTVPSPSPCREGVAPQSLKQPEYEESMRPLGDFMASFVQSFLQTVQTESFPKDLVLEIVKEPGNTVTNQEFVKKVLLYEKGFLVCAAIGILYIVLMPIVGLFLACCRCCGKCGGKMYQKQTPSTHSFRRMLYLATFVTTVIILAGNICMFRSNKAFKVSVENSAVDLNKTFNNINTFLTAVPQQVQFVMNESSLSIQEVTHNLDSIGIDLGSAIQKRFESPFTSALQSLVTMDKEVVNISGLLNKLNTSLTSLESSTKIIQNNITAVKKQINQTLSRPDCINCATVKPELNKIATDTSINTSILSEMEKIIDEIIKADLNSKVNEVQELFKNIPEIVTNDTRTVVQSSKKELEKIQSQISNMTTELPFSSLDGVLSQLQQFQKNINNYSPEVERAEYIRWRVCITLCCMVLLVGLCNLCGLILAPLGLKPQMEPTKRSFMSNCGGTFFMMGAGFSFLISWLFMILVVILFLVGGNAYTLLCKPLKDGELLKLIDTPGVIPGFNLSTFGVNITISSIYQDCNENKPAWSVFHLNQLINLDDLLNVSKYTNVIAKEFENFNIGLSPVTFLTPKMKKQLQNFSSKGNSIDFTTPVQQLNNISSINLNTTAAKLDLLATTTAGQTKQELTNEAQSLRAIQSDIETIIFPKLATVNSTIDELKTAVGGINATVGEVLRSVEVAQDFNKNATDIVKTESRAFLNCQLGYFTALVDWAKITITQEMVRCGPVAGAVNSAEIIVCSNMVESLNAFWFSLGWCMIFLIPSIILSIKLAKYYRRMKYADVFDDRIKLNYIPRAQMKFS